MKNILLIGDSIRLGYDEYVKITMKNAANVVFPKENCRFSEYILRNLHNWTDELKLYEADVVHWNAGHWDTVRIYNDKPLTSIENYKDNIRRINERIRFLFPSAVIVFAMSTPVIESGYIKDFEMRYNSDVEEYNEAAKEICKQQGVIINDLYSLLKDKPDSFHSDQTHYYTPDATELIGRHVCEVICELTDTHKTLLEYPDKSLFARPGVKGDKEMYVKHGNIYKMNTEIWSNKDL